jgi:hypothetical protein
MKKLIAVLLFAVPSLALADYVDVLAGKLKPGCNAATLQQIVKDFNDTWGAKEYGYTAEILWPLQSRDLGTIYWVGRVADSTAFGKGFDAWRAAQSDANSVAGKLGTRLLDCVAWESRAGYASL